MLKIIVMLLSELQKMELLEKIITLEAEFY